MPLPLRDFVHQVLIENGRDALIFQAIKRSWEGTSEKYPERGRWRRKSTFRGLVWEEIVSDLAAIEATDKDFRLVSHRDTVSFIVEDAVLFRVKHADVTLATTNYPTPEAVSFDNHEVDLYGYIGLQRVELCYVLNEFETSIIWVGIAARSNGVHLWKIELSDSGVLAPVETLPLEPETESDPAQLAKLRPTSTPQDKKEKEK